MSFAIIESIDPVLIPNPITIFGESLVGELHPQFQVSLEYTVSNAEITTQTKRGSGTVTHSQGMGVVSTGVTTGSNGMLSSKQRAKYKAGLGGALRFTVIFDDPIEGTEQYIGLMDRHSSTAAFQNGYSIGYDGTIFGFHRFQGGVKFTTPLSEWDDPLDGSGFTGLAFAPKKLNVFYIRYQYLGGGAMEVWCENQNGSVSLVHIARYAGLFTEPSVFNPNFKFHMHVENKSTTQDIVMKTSSFAYFVEGKTNQIELHQPQFSTGLIETTSVTTEVPLLTIRNKAQYFSKVNFIDSLLEHVVVSIEASGANNLGSIRLIRDAVLTGPTEYKNINVTDSIMDFDIASTGLSGGKHILSGPLAGKNDKIVELLKPLEIIQNAGETVTIAGKSAASATFQSELLWKELF